MMNSSEALNEFIKLIDNPNATLSELSDLIGKISVDDLVAPENATTHLYTKVVVLTRGLLMIPLGF